MIQEFDNSAVAKDIEAVCSKCGESWHVIVAVENGKIAKVQCKSCGGSHKYKPVAADRRAVKKSTKTIIADDSPSVPRTSPKTTSTRSASKPTKSAEPTILEPRVAPNDRPQRAYNMHETDYQLGDTIEHAKFGVGTVDELPAPNKMYVTFQTQRVLLIYGK